MGFLVLFSILLGLVLFSPNALGEPDNFIQANPINTPSHIVPEWYFLFAYAILRAVPNKLGGVVGLFASLLLLFLLPFLNRRTLKGNAFYPYRKILYWLFVLSFIILTIGGSWPVEEPFNTTRILFSFLYFSFFITFAPTRFLRDKLIYYPKSNIYVRFRFYVENDHHHPSPPNLFSRP